MRKAAEPAPGPASATLRGGRRGSLLVVTLWLIAVLAAAAVALGGYLSVETRLMRYHLAQAQAKAWARAGIVLAMQRLAEDLQQADSVDDVGNPRFYDWLGDEWAYVAPVDPDADPTQWTVSFPLEDQQAGRTSGAVTIQIIDEDRKLDLNTADVLVIQRLLNDPDIAQAIVDYQDVDDEGLDDSVEPPYQPKNALIQAIEELWEIPLVEASATSQAVLEQEATVYAEGAININTATVGVLAPLVAIDDVDEVAEAERLVAARPGADGQFGGEDCVAVDPTTATADLTSCSGASQEWLTSLMSVSGMGVVSSVFRIHVEGTVETPFVRYPIEAIVKRDATEEPKLRIGEKEFQILAWKEGG